jgi:hypothetical protein
MWKLKLCLPTVQFVVAVAMLSWGHRVGAPRRFDTLYVPTVSLLSFGINAPATLLAFIAELLPIRRIDRAPASVFGFGIAELSFLVGVIILWYLIGRVLDRRGRPGGVSQGEATVWVVSVQLLVMMWGACIFFEALESFRHPGQYNNPIGNLAEGLLFLLWSLSLIVFPAAKLVNATRRRLGGAARSS